MRDTIQFGISEIKLDLFRNIRNKENTTRNFRNIEMQSNWEEAHSVALRELVEKGMSFAEVARSLNARFGTSFTRNATIV